MKILDLRVTPLLCRLKQPCHWAQGVTHSSSILLVEIETAGGIVGVGETKATPNVEAALAVVADFRPHIVGESIYDDGRIRTRCYRSAFAVHGSGRSKSPACCAMGRET